MHWNAGILQPATPIIRGQTDTLQHALIEKTKKSVFIRILKLQDP